MLLYDNELLIIQSFKWCSAHTLAKGSNCQFNSHQSFHALKSKEEQ
jgi:hypothetical protein